MHLSSCAETTSSSYTSSHQEHVPMQASVHEHGHMACIYYVPRCIIILLKIIQVNEWGSRDPPCEKYNGNKKSSENYNIVSYQLSAAMHIGHFCAKFLRAMAMMLVPKYRPMVV